MTVAPKCGRLLPTRSSRPRERLFTRIRISTTLVSMSLLFSTTRSFAHPRPFEIWFAPTLPAIQSDGRQTGSVDYDNLFRSDVPWKVVASRISVFQTYQSYIIRRPLDDLRRMVQFLDKHKIKLAVEFGPMNRDPDGCGAGVEGFAAGGAKAGRALAVKIKRAGGSLAYIAMDEPYWGGHVTQPKNACHLTAKEMAANVRVTVRAVQSIFPDVRFGDTEPVQFRPGVDLPKEYAEWLDAWQSAIGTPMAFFHADVLWQDSPNPRIAALALMLRQKKIPFGLIYNGNSHDQSDDAWLRHARERFLNYETGQDPLPDQAVFESWNFYPSHVLPESGEDTHTHLVLQYLAHRGQFQN
jgi:hypothetical protein